MVMTDCNARTVTAEVLDYSESQRIAESAKCEDTHRKHFLRGALLACDAYVTMKGLFHAFANAYAQDQRTCAHRHAKRFR